MSDAPSAAPPAIPSGPLTARYRPQRFADVAGQEMVTSILSRASQEDRIAPAYLLSGTRGVGKTTCARIFAKAINCVTAPTAEPCNECQHCRQITQGASVDVVEMDGASNRGIDDARRLREDVAFAPMACRYKVCIIDEAHMLTREAFNALLKTLEEPPGNVTFILATTEAHKFPATIISRCQHFIFKRLTHARLVQHLEGVLQNEGIPYEDAAIQLLARRAAGSVRDGMSLLGQVLALGQGTVQDALVRDLLGLAGQDMLQDMLAAIRSQDPVTLTGQLKAMLDQGLDMGFFLRELAQAWRNLFLLKQSGEAALPLLEMSSDAAAAWLAVSKEFSLAHIHAGWQMTLEGQRRVLTSLEPALALELLLLNLAYLPRLLPVASLQPEEVPPASGAQQGLGGAAPAMPSGASMQGAPSSGAPVSAAAPTPSPQRVPQSNPQPAPQPAPVPEAQRPGPKGTPPWDTQAAPAAVPQDAVPPASTPQELPATAPAAAPAGPKTWDGFLEYFKARLAETGLPFRLTGVTPLLEPTRIVLPCTAEFTYNQLMDPAQYEVLTTSVRAYYGEGMALEIQQPAPTMSRQDLEAKITDHPVVKAVQSELSGRIIHMDQLQDRSQ